MLINQRVPEWAVAAMRLSPLTRTFASPRMPQMAIDAQRAATARLNAGARTNQSARTKKAAPLSTSDAKSILNRMEHRRIMSGVGRILPAPRPPRDVTIAQAKRTLAVMATNNKKHGIAPHRDIVIALPVDNRCR